MGNSANRIDEYQERKVKRLKNAETYTVNKSAGEKVRARAHVEAANVTDFSVTALGSKTLGALTGGAWGLAKGLIVGAFFGVAVGALLSGGVVVFGAIAAYMTLKGCRDGYYHAENNYSGKSAKKIGDKIAADGNAQAPVVKPEITLKAAQQAKEEMDKLPAAERQNLDHRDHLPTDRKFQDMINEERSAKAKTQTSLHRT